MSAATTVPAPPPTRTLAAVVQRMQRRHVRAASLGALLSTLLLLAIPGIAVVWLLPSFSLPVGLAASTVAAVVALRAAWRARRHSAARFLQFADSTLVDASKLAELDDELTTWLEAERTAVGSTAVRQWLGCDVEARLRALPPAALVACGRPRLGRWINLLPFVLLLLLLWWLAEWLSPPWRGVVGGRADGRATSSGGAGDGEPAPASNSESEGSPRKPPRGDAPPPQPTEAPPKPPEPAPAEPSPLLNLPEQQRFVLPEFIDDGPTRRARMRAAELEVGGGASGSTSSGAEAERPPPPPTSEQFARAAEAALRSRHVPPAEQPIVRRFFERLRETDK